MSYSQWLFIALLVVYIACSAVARMPLSSMVSNSTVNPFYPSEVRVLAKDGSF